jgi:hypothetical protein
VCEKRLSGIRKGHIILNAKFLNTLLLEEDGALLSADAFAPEQFTQ